MWAFDLPNKPEKQNKKRRQVVCQAVAVKCQWFEYPKPKTLEDAIELYG